MTTKINEYKGWNIYSSPDQWGGADQLCAEKNRIVISDVSVMSRLFEKIDAFENPAAITEAITEKVVKVEIPQVRCSCGHTVNAEMVMNASLGSSCPDCYDRMS